MSERTSTGALVNCSGLANAGVPTNPPCVSAIAFVFSEIAFATPKSITFACGRDGPVALFLGGCDVLVALSFEEESGGAPLLPASVCRALSHDGPDRALP